MNRLKELRKEKGMTAKQLADILKTTDSTIIRWENSKQNISIDILKELSNIYNVSIDYILCLTDLKENIQLEEEEVKLLDNYRELDTKSKTIVQEQINTLKKLL
ncbi:TPA: helix-turn-helix transcriptional regulator [Clostridioides difficile]|uniref:helix-turn-helix transcriptional regulator n=1 Tax=Clostridioides difficile TaxID=1496 RepID=UPI00093FA836|nr:helix-turn-helix transcriptional regulator [Clostridioides difficile]EGT4117267.1 XRE family transcriptional regulator [Clostridioides difficile]MCG3625846.1 helix-turn-helix domain-containing protein [Clostridioides difficile]MCU5789010.1 helix-turn-helix transcriptional regulator [Clostridioides difficile]MDB0488102.1 XRE family transcriptional regulator [Clostridioides difficile]MDB2934611.1 XRE family transcriptional regulator [Clostridioides difficile]